MRRAIAALGLTLLLTGCSEPPQKEIDRAQGAIDAARAAGAEQYASEPFTAATTAMQQTHEAVQQRDYRLALSRAIDANERALEAARQAANGKARARSDAEAAIGRGATALRQLDEQLKAADANRLPPAETAGARKVRADVDKALQEARTALGSGDFLTASAAVKAVPEQVAEQIRGLSEVLDQKLTRGGKRRR